jgi:hypothetical protein
MDAPIPVICQLKTSIVVAPAPYNASPAFGPFVSDPCPGQETDDPSGCAPPVLMVHKTGWPERTGVLCHWCCAPFDTQPVGIPVTRCPGDAPFRVTGNFCGLECAAAYNFSSLGDTTTAWERHAMINEISARMGDGGNAVVPAPPRELLEHLGGDMTVDDFRSRNCRVKMVYPALMVAEPQHVEEVHACLIHRSSSYLPVDSQRLDKYKVKLKRQKPRQGYMSTLDYVLGMDPA